MKLTGLADLIGSDAALDRASGSMASKRSATLVLPVGARPPAIAALAGAGAGLGAWILEFAMGNYEKGPAFLVIYLVCCLISGALLGGLVAWYLAKGLARTGALDRFAAGREIRTRV